MEHMTETALELFLDLAKYYNGVPAGVQLLRHLVDHILFNPALWIHTPVKVSLTRAQFHRAAKHKNLLGMKFLP